LRRAPPKWRRAKIHLLANPLFELQVNAAASGINSNAALCGGNPNYHTGLI
jgi:hypothetical protein